MSKVRSQFRAAAGLVGPHALNWTVIAETASAVQATEKASLSHDSYAQVESLVIPNSRGGLPPGGVTWDEQARKSDSPKRPPPITVRLSEQQKQIIRAKAQAASMPVNRFMLASALGSDYRPPADPQLTRALLRMYRELNAQGNNLNQIAGQLNAGVVLPGQGAMLDALAASIHESLRHVQAALVGTRGAAT
jgi:hypothetical protein